MEESSGGLKSRIKWLMFFRVAIASFFFGIAAFTQLQESDSCLSTYMIYMYCLFGAVYSITCIYVLLLKKIKNLQLFAYGQIFIDIILITGLVFITGGLNSIFSFMYSISIISASILLYMAGGIFTATTASLAYSALIIMQHYQMISPVHAGSFVATGYKNAPLYFPIIVSVSTFYLVALLSSFVSEQGRKSRMQLYEKQLDVENLEALNENIIQSIHSGLVTLDREGRIITFNRAAQEITELSLSQVHMKYMEEVFASWKLPLRTHASGSDFENPRFETTFRKPGGRSLYLGFSLASLKDKSANEIGKIIVFQDLTKLKEMQGQVQRMDRLAAIGRLAAGIAHEVRNPLASISGSIQVLKKGLRLSDSDKRLMDIIIRESSNLSDLISEFTQFARPNKHKKQVFNLTSLVQEVVEMFKNSPECGQSITINQNMEGDININANYQQIKQVLWNLVINAVQAIEHTGEISISVWTKTGDTPIENNSTEENNRNPVAIEIKDTGTGIDKKIIDKIFDPFYTSKDTGTGLGLVVVHKIIQEHEGTISVDSSQESGTCFTIILPQESDNLLKPD